MWKIFIDCFESMHMWHFFMGTIPRLLCLVVNLLTAIYSHIKVFLIQMEVGSFLIDIIREKSFLDWENKCYGLSKHTLK
mgnify:CR=1 FL=1